MIVMVCDCYWVFRKSLVRPVGQTDVKSLEPITTLKKTGAPEGKDSLCATTTSIGKGDQALCDISQSVTVLTGKLIDDRNLDTLKNVLPSTAGFTFQAAEGGAWGVPEIYSYSYQFWSLVESSALSVRASAQ